MTVHEGYPHVRLACSSRGSGKVRGLEAHIAVQVPLVAQRQQEF